jgi:hypothetical protein
MGQTRAAFAGAAHTHELVRSSSRAVAAEPEALANEVLGLRSRIELDGCAYQSSYSSHIDGAHRDEPLDDGRINLRTPRPIRSELRLAHPA